MKTGVVGLAFTVCLANIALCDDRAGKRTEPANIDWDDPGEVLEAVAGRSAYWTGSQSPELQSLHYTYLLGRQPRQVQLKRMESKVRYSLWQGCSLRTGIHTLLGQPDRFSLEVAHDTDDTTIRLTATVKTDAPPVGIEVGNGIDGSWRGFYTHSTRKLVLIIDKERLVPLEERSGPTTLRFGDWKQIDPQHWVPGKIDILKGQTRYRMHFAWMGDAVWLLTRGEVISRSGTTVVARTRDVAVNGKGAVRELSQQERGRLEAADVIRRMLAHNQAWLSPRLATLDSIEYTFHTVREDIRETGYLNQEGFAVIEVVHDGQGKMGDRLGDRRIALPTQQYALTHRDARFAKINSRPKRLKDQPVDNQIRHYARIGCQFDLPLFRLGERIDGAKIEIDDGQWMGKPCLVARVSDLGRDVYFGAGTMFGFSSWSYVHHIRPAYELIYIDKQSHRPIHETLLDSDRERAYEIDFLDYVEVGEGNWAPLSIRIEAKDYFNADYRFQLVEGKHWLLKEVVSWFDSDNKSRGVVENLRVNQASELYDASVKQVDASRRLYREDQSDSSLPIASAPIVFGKRTQLGPYTVMLTITESWKTVLRVETTDPDAASVFPFLLLDDRGRPLFAAHANLALTDGRNQAAAELGSSRVLSDVRFIATTGIPTGSGTGPRVAFVPSQWNEPIEINVPDTDKGDTRAYAIRLSRSDDGIATARMSVASSAGPAEFLLDLSVALLDDDANILAAASRTVTMLVKRGIVEADHDIVLGPVSEPARATRMVIAVTAGDTLSMPVGSLWGRVGPIRPAIPLEQLLGADDDACRRLGLDSLARQIRLDKEVFGSPLDRARLKQRGGTREAILGQYVSDLVSIAGQTGDDQVLAAALRLLGHSGDRRHQDVVREQLGRGNDRLRDVAAVSLAMLGSPDGFDRLPAILARRQPTWESQREARRVFDLLEADLLVGLAALGNDRSIRLLGETLRSDLASLTIKTDDQNRERLNGRPDRIRRIVSVLGYCKNDEAVPWLTMAADFFVDHADMAELVDQIPIATALLEYQPQTRELIATRIAKGDFAYIRTMKTNDEYDPYYVPAVHKMLLNPDTTAWTAYQGVTYLWNVGTPEARDVLRDAHTRGVHQEDIRTRFHICEALAALGDDRGLDDAFSALTEVYLPAQPPTDEKQRESWEDRREDLEDGARDSLERFSQQSIAAFVDSKAETEHAAERRALIELLWYLPETPKSIVPELRGWNSDSDATLSEELDKLLNRD